MMLRTNSEYLSAISHFVVTVLDDWNPFQFALLRVVDSEFVLPRASEWVSAIYKRTGSEPEIVKSGLLLHWDTFLVLVNQRYFNGFDEVWLTADQDGFRELEASLVDNIVGPYEAFDDSPQAFVFREHLADQKQTVGLLDGTSLFVITNNKKLHERFMNRLDTNLRTD